MPIDPYAALNAMLRAEVSRFAPPVRQSEPIAPPKTPAPSVEDDGEPQHATATQPAVASRTVGARTAAGDSAA
ncbi:hypothetical protein [Streptomyces erythrochromogenes]|uniref:hypothetical protein n=1 Tax=Streptomyces erythrochromogenes TaxID=285574 RepID=UPI0038234E18|nr:hypothetical protein OG489_20785 [Streptomyces erythrochromogenes]